MKYLLPLTVIAGLIIFFHPLFKPGLVAGHDTGARLIHIQMMAQALKDGQFPVRWVEGPAPGLSHPLFNYYPPLFYYPPAFLILLGMDAVTSIYVTLILAGAIGLVGMFFLVGNFAGAWPAAICAMLFLFTPYRISQVYVRATYMEFAAVSVIPFAFLGILSIFKSRKISGLIVTAVSLAAIITLHQPTFIMIFPALLAWIGYLWIKYSSSKGVYLGFLSIAVSLILAASFLLPLVGEGRFIRSAVLSSNYFDFRQHFAAFSQLIYSPWGYGISQAGPGDGMSFQVGVLNWVILVFALGLIFWHRFYRKISPPPQTGLIVFLTALFFYGAFMATAASLPVWERFSVLWFIQYPWRYLSVTSFATAILALTAATVIPKNYLLGLMAVMIVFNWQYLAPAAYLPRNNFTFGSTNFPHTDPMMGLEPGYFPATVTQTNTDPSLPRFQVVQGKAEIKSLTEKTTKQEFTAEVKTPATIRVNTHYFPGWQAKIDDGKEISLITPGYNNPEGNMEITLTPGDYTVSLEFTKTQLRKLADYLSLGTALGLAVLAIFSRSRFWSKYWEFMRAARAKRSKAAFSSPRRKK